MTMKTYVRQIFYTFSTMAYTYFYRDVFLVTVLKIVIVGMYLLFRSLAGDKKSSSENNNMYM
jgi:hypothetical protein